jgi:hypothetical protein
MPWGGGSSPYPLPNEICTWGSHGWIGRVIRDAPKRAVSDPTCAAILTLASVGVGALFFASGPQSSDLAKVFLAVAGGAVGIAFAIILIALYGLTPVGRRYHWRWLSTFSPEGRIQTIEPRSQHWHRLNHVVIEVTGPGCALSLPWPPLDPRRDRLVHPGTTAGVLSIEIDLGPNPPPGRYRARWLINCDGRSRPVAIARTKFRI